MPGSKRSADCGFDDDQNGTGADYLKRFGPTLFVDIGLDPSYAPQSRNPESISVASDLPALVDTGASETFIDTQLAIALNLPIIDRDQPLAGAGGEHKADVYLARVRIPALDFTIYGKFYGVNLTEGGVMHRALIGRTFLQDHMLVYRGKTGKVTLSG